MRAIETVYNGYRFRSRLEARWAVFFDAVGEVWKYEAEGFDVDGRWYLPDFYLPGPDVWVEVKGSLTPAETVELRRLLTAASRGLGRPMIVLSGDVGWPFLGERPREGVSDATIWFIDECPDRVRNLVTIMGALDAWSGTSLHQFVSLFLGRYVAPEVVYEASKRARGARFEHGETPQRTPVVLPPAPPPPPAVRDWNPLTDPLPTPRVPSLYDGTRSLSDQIYESLTRKDPPASPAPRRTVDLEAVRDAMPALLIALADHGPDDVDVAALLRDDAHLEGVADGIITLSFASDAYRRTLLHPVNRIRIEKALRRLLTAPCRVRMTQREEE